MKRKRDEERSVEGKRAPADNQESTQDALSRILLLENGILESRKNYNSIVLLLDRMRERNPSDGRYTAAAVALFRVFCKLIALGNLTKNPQVSKEENTVVLWLWERLEEYEEALLNYLQSEDDTKQVAALTLLLRLIKEKARHLITSESVNWDAGLFQRIVHGLLMCRYGATAIDEFVDKYVAKHADIRLHTFTSIS